MEELKPFFFATPFLQITERLIRPPFQETKNSDLEVFSNENQIKRQ